MATLRKLNEPGLLGRPRLTPVEGPGFGWILIVLLLVDCTSCGPRPVENAAGREDRAQNPPIGLDLRPAAGQQRPPAEDPNTPDVAGYPPLAWAVLHGDDPRAAELLASGADPHWRGEDGITLLHLVCSWPPGDPNGLPPHRIQPTMTGKRRVLDRLLARGLDPNLPDKREMRPLHYAVALPGTDSEVRAIVDLLVAAGASTTATNEYGLNPGELARRRGRTAIAELLARKAEGD